MDVEKGRITERKEVQIDNPSYLVLSHSGKFLYSICDQIDGKENGTYVLLSKFEDDVIFEYHITVMDHEFNLGILTMKLPEGVYAVNFDED